MSNILIVLTIALLPFAASFHLNLKDNVNATFKHSSNEQQTLDSNLSISLEQFIVLKELGKGAFGSVYLVKKNAGPDEGKFYALKVLNITRVLMLEKAYKTKSLNIERDALEVARDWPFASGLHYAWREGQWAFLVMDLGVGGHIESKISKKRPSVATAKLILAELVLTVEKLHSSGLSHSDIQIGNMMIDVDGHLMLIDFGIASRLQDNRATRYDWENIHYVCDRLFSFPVRTWNEYSLTEMLLDMTDAQLPELKSHPYFNGIDWDQVAAKKCEPPFEPTKIEFNEENPIDLVAKLQIDVNVQLDENVLDRLCNYTFIAPENVHID